MENFEQVQIGLKQQHFSIHIKYMQRLAKKFSNVFLVHYMDPSDMKCLYCSLKITKYKDFNKWIIPGGRRKLSGN